MKPFVWLGLGVILVVALSLFSIATGATPFPFADIVTALQKGFGLPTQNEVAEPVVKIIVDLRLPRTLLAIMAGAGLALVGVLLQTVTRNDLADPFLFGLSSGAAAGAVSIITTFGDHIGIWSLPLAAFAGGLLSALIVMLLIHRRAWEGPERIVLAGLAVSFLFSAVTNYMVFAGDQRAAHSVLFWSLGGLGLARWDNLPFALAGLVILIAFVAWRRPALDALLAGEETAYSLGVDAERLAREVFIVSAFATATIVSLVGVIGFVGLMVPHIARAVTGVTHGSLSVFSLIFGAGLLLASDIASRTMLAPQELPVGIITGSVGGLFVLALVLRPRRLL